MKFYDLKEIKEIDDLKVLGSIDEIETLINNEIKPLNISVSTYDDIFDAISILKEKWIDLFDGPFISKQVEYVYYLTELEGEERNRKLGITDDMYLDKEKAQKWFWGISKFVHPDKNNEDNNSAFNVLNNIYEVMTDNSGDFGDE